MPGQTINQSGTLRTTPIREEIRSDDSVLEELPTEFSSQRKEEIHVNVTKTKDLNDLYRSLSGIQLTKRYNKLKLVLPENDGVSDKDYYLSRNAYLFFKALLKKPGKKLCIEHLELVNLSFPDENEWLYFFLEGVLNIRDLKSLCIDRANFDYNNHFLALIYLIRAQSSVQTVHLYVKPDGDEAVEPVKTYADSDRDEALALAFAFNPRLTSFAYNTKENPGDLGEKASQHLCLNTKAQGYFEENRQGVRATQWYGDLKKAFISHLSDLTGTDNNFKTLRKNFQTELENTYEQYNGTPADKRSWEPLRHILQFFDLQEKLRCHLQSINNLDETNQDFELLKRFVDDFFKQWAQKLESPKAFSDFLIEQMGKCEANSRQLKDQKLYTWVKNALLIISSLLLLGIPLLINRYYSGHFFFQSENQRRIKSIQQTLQDVKDTHTAIGQDRDRAEIYCKATQQ